jgi:hypothetical protein
MLPQSQVVSPDFNFNRIAKGCKANQLNFGPDEQAHFHETRAAGRRNIYLSDSGSGSKWAGGERLCGGHGSSRLHLGRRRFDENGVGQLSANAEPRVANLADDAGARTEELNLLLFSETHLTKTDT